MLTQIRKIKGLGVFDEYSPAADFPSFGRYNVIYGENGAGKTTLSRLLGCLEAGHHTDHPDLEYAVETQSGPLVRGANYVRRVRVFNSDFIEASIGRLDGPLRHILILGEENREIAAELTAEAATRDQRKQRLSELEPALAKSGVDRGKLFSAIARTIGEATSGSSLRSYRKPDAEAAYARLQPHSSLDDLVLEQHRTTIRQAVMEPIGQLTEPQVVVGDGRSVDVLAHCAGAAMRARALIRRTAQSAVIERLSANPDISNWVEAGVSLHADHDPDRCEYCGQSMPADRLNALANHFSAEDQRLREDIEVERVDLRAIMETLRRFVLRDASALYGELRDEWTHAGEQLQLAVAALAGQLKAIDAALVEKLTQRTKAYETELVADVTACRHFHGELVTLAGRHDAKTASFDEARDSARLALEGHYLHSIRAQVAEFDSQATGLQVEIDLLTNGGPGLADVRGLEAIEQSIRDKQAQVSNAHAGGEGLTSHLKQFLGRTDLRFESGEDGYRVLRRGKPAKRLSEGEKTAIAFLYFLVQLRDQNFDLAEGVVVIDDPISSLDASAIYQAFSVLKNETQGARQLFIMTHNFEFLRLLLNWVKSTPRAITKSYSMVLCSESATGRSARLVPLDKLLLEHATEYHYLFKVLHTFKSDGTILGCYHVPNIARKVLETFLDFHVPSNRSLYQKLDETDFDQHKKTAIYKFANDLSHHTGKAFDPALVAETQKNVAYLLEMIEAVAPLHYAGLTQLSEA
ncbi:AAA family ATPase [Sphingobium yanoikuyae]|uniref:AAA family ATPase n=1 Tax=Sphingobium yanoikuyae TaxID=13690 RepID=UPI002898CB96|nr:AAA family ATPase [Sphingobium yanoikuyae]